MADHYIFLLIGFGTLVLLTAWLPMALKKRLYRFHPLRSDRSSALRSSVRPSTSNLAANLPIAERFTELVIIISLMGAALKIDRKIGCRSWSKTWRRSRHDRPSACSSDARFRLDLLAAHRAGQNAQSWHRKCIVLINEASRAEV